MQSLLRKLRTACSLALEPGGIQRLKRAFGENLRTLRVALPGSVPFVYQHANGSLFAVVPRAPETRELYIRGQGYEESETKVLRTWLQHGDFVVDCGANVGLISALAADCVGPDGMVWAIEASPSTRQKLEAVINTLGLHRVSVVPKAVSDCAGEVFFRDDASASEANSICSDTGLPDSMPSASCRVVTTSLEDLISLASPRQPALIKLDIEGAEPLAFRGWPSIARTSSLPMLVFEVYPRGLGRLGFSPDDIFAALPTHRYRFWHLNASWPNDWPEFPRGVPFLLTDPIGHSWPMHSNVIAVPLEGCFAPRMSLLSGLLPGI